MASIDRLAAAVARQQHGAFSLHQVEGLTKHLARNRTRSGRWQRVGVGVYVIAGTPPTWEQHLWITLLRAGDGAVVARRAACRLHRIGFMVDTPLDIDQPEATVPLHRTAAMRRTSLLPASHVTVIDGFPVTKIERTLFDLAGLTSPQRRRRGWPYLSAPRVERLVDHALARQLTTPSRLAQVLTDLARRGRPGTQCFRSMLLERTDGYVATESELEDLFVAFTEAHHLPKPRRQVRLGDRVDVIARADFVFDDAHLIVEVDGSRHHDLRTAAMSDRRRDLKLRALGWETLRIDWWQLVKEPQETASLLRRVLIAEAE